MTTMIQGSQQRALLYGTKVEKAATTVPQNANAPLFTVTGGRVLITALIGEVTTVIAGTTPSMKMVLDPTAAGTNSDMCTATAITDDAVGTLYSLGTALVVSVGGVGSVTGAQVTAVVDAGTINMNVSAADATGAIAWTLFYVPLDDGATVAAV